MVYEATCKQMQFSGTVLHVFNWGAWKWMHVCWGDPGASFPRKFWNLEARKSTFSLRYVLKKHSTWILLGTSSAYSNIMEFLKTWYLSAFIYPALSTLTCMFIQAFIQGLHYRQIGKYNLDKEPVLESYPSIWEWCRTISLNHTHVLYNSILPISG